MTTIQVFTDAELIRGTADFILAAAKQAIAERGRFSLALSGGSTPRPVYELLAEAPYRDAIDWSRTHIWWGDERCVPPDDKQSNYRLAHEALLDKVPLPSTNIHRMRGEIEPTAAAEEYEQELTRYFAQGDETGPPLHGLDLVLLGMGDNGHTASLFPYQPAVHEQSRSVVAEYIEEVKMWRMTLTPLAIDASRLIVFLVSGTGKAQRLNEVLNGPYDPDRSPAQVIRATGGGEIVWLVDQSAAAQLETQS